MPRTPLIAGNWKMNTTVDEASALVQALLPGLQAVESVEKLVCPPYISLVPVSGLLRGSSIALGAQNMYSEDKGAFTGEISPTMLVGICEYVILGHSERRHILGEKDPLVAQKVRAAVNHRLKPILCVGENKEQRDQGWAESVVSTQVRSALGGVPFDPGLVVAYEPVWAIGTGVAATPDIANDMCALIRREVGALYTESRAQQVRILYGGSVSPKNIAEFMEEREIDGALVGGASLVAADFVSLTQIAAQVAKAKAGS